jgi:electron transfer flavoprotein beta subunit
MRDPKVVVLLSAGIHPVSGRARMAPGDARALEMALRLGPRPIALHVGDASNIGLRDYLGMGLEMIEVLGTWTDGDDIVPTLRERLAKLKPDLVLTGMAADAGEASGMVPYLLAHGLGIRHVSSIASIDAIEAGEAIVVQAYRGATRRRLAVSLPAVISASELAPAPRARAFARSRRGALQMIVGTVAKDHEAATWTRAPARRRPKKITAGQAAGDSAPLVGLTPDEAAYRILDFLKDKNIIQESGQ